MSVQSTKKYNIFLALVALVVAERRSHRTTDVASRFCKAGNDVFDEIPGTMIFRKGRPNPERPLSSAELEYL